MPALRKIVDGFFHIAVGFFKSFFTFAHADAGAFAQFFNHLRSDFRSWLFLFCFFFFSLFSDFDSLQLFCSRSHRL